MKIVQINSVFGKGSTGKICLGIAELLEKEGFDNRVLYSAGRVAMEIGLLPKEVSDAVGIPLSVTSKNAFFDRGSSDNEAMLKREMERRGKNRA